MRVSESYRRITREKKNKEATNISNISPCDGVLIPIVVDPIKKRSTEGFFFFFFSSKDPPEKGNESGQGQGERANCVNKLMGL
jgi:hypothetical protein